MATKNNKTETLVSTLDDDPTAELEVLSDTLIAEPSVPAARESDELTCTFDESENVDEIPVAQLRSDLRTRNASIHKLQYDIEQLRARWTGLEKEIKAREKISDDLNDQLRSARQQLAEHKERLASQEKTNAVLREKIAGKNAEIASASAELTSIQDNAGTGSARIAVLEMQHQSDAATIEFLEDELQRLREPDSDDSGDVGPDSHAVRDLQQQLRQSQAALADLEQYVESRKTAWQEQKDEIAARDRRLEKQADEIAALTSQAKTAALPAASDDTLQQSGTVSYAVQDLYGLSEYRDMQAQVERTESYADSLRHHVHDAINKAERQGRYQVQLQQALDNALDQIRSLRAQLDEERLMKSDVDKKKSDMQRRYDEQVDNLQSELTEMRNQVELGQSANDKLAAEVADSNGSARDLEDQLQEAEKQLADKQAELNELIRDRHEQLEEAQEKLESKDSAISALLNELAAKNSVNDSLDEIGHAVHDLDDRMLASIDDHATGGDRDRSARLLICTIDGQKLRFPLFKDRLTIGRGADNDIQLKTQCISRRHAIIVNDSKECRIEDHGSKNGVFINGTRVKEAPLVSGDKLVIGTALLIYEERSKR